MNEPDELAKRRRFRELVRELGRLLRHAPEARAEQLLQRDELTDPKMVDERRGAA